MISTMSDILYNIMAKITATLEKQGITHAPTIGEMYEGLAKNILNESMPFRKNITICSGFIRGEGKKLSRQVDIMVAVGQGEKIPFTENFIFDVKNVLCVIEVKKKIDIEKIKDSFSLFSDISKMKIEYLENGNDDLIDRKGILSGFAQITGMYPRTLEEKMDMPLEISSVYDAIIHESQLPVRILFSYDGYGDEFNLRRAFSKIVESFLGVSGVGTTYYPNLLICGKNSILKLNGQPYSAQMTEDWWPFLASSSENPLRLMMEVIWTRLANIFRISIHMDDSLAIEAVSPLMLAKTIAQDGKLGWGYRFIEIKQSLLGGAKSKEWEPELINDVEWIVLQMISKFNTLSICDKNFIQYTKNLNVSNHELISSLQKKRLIAISGNEIRIINNGALMTAHLPDGRIVASTHKDLFLLWMNERNLRTQPDD